MRHSIRFKLFFVFIALLATFQLIFFLVNTYFLEDIFIWSSKRSMENIYSDFKSKLNEGQDEEALIHELNSDFGGNITVVDVDLEAIVSTYSRFSKNRLTRILPGIREIKKEMLKHIDQGGFFFVSSQENIRMRIIVFVGRLPDNRLFIIEKPFRMVHESSRIAEQFMLFSGIGTLIVGAFIVYLLSGRLTKPVIRINQVAREIAELKFDNKVEIASKDEIGALGASINLISDKLSYALNELKESNLKLQADIEQERKMEKMRRRFVSSVSHELKTPISMIQGYADGLKHGTAKNEADKAYYCDVIVEESEKMSHLIKDLLDLSSYESGIFKINKVSFDLADLIRETTGKYRKDLEQKNVRLEILSPESCVLVADKLRMEQVVSNFLSNAEKHVYENGSIEIQLTDSEDTVYLSVYNTGNLIDPDEIENIWTSFYKAEPDRAGDKDGTGLGLAIVKAIIELHNGRYGVDSLDHGVRFWVELPRLHHKTITLTD